MKNIKLYPSFNHWLKYDAIYLISDTHFDDNDCKYMNPNWITPEEHMAILKKVLNKQTLLIHLGDVGNASYLDELKCYKVLITGNHDILSKVASHFDEVYNGPLFIADRILLSHEPIYGLESFALNIHGHVHNGYETLISEIEEGYCRTTHVNLASDVVKWKPMTLNFYIKAGFLSQIPNYHRLTIKKATEKGIDKNPPTQVIINLPPDIKSINSSSYISGPCENCSTNPKNGGSGICNCTNRLPQMNW